MKTTTRKFRLMPALLIAGTLLALSACSSCPDCHCGRDRTVVTPGGPGTSTTVITPAQ